MKIINYFLPISLNVCSTYYIIVTIDLFISSVSYSYFLHLLPLDNNLCICRKGWSRVGKIRQEESGKIREEIGGKIREK